MNNRIIIQRISRRFRILFTLLAAATPLLPVVIWGAFNYLPEIVRERIFGNAGAGPVREISLAARGIGCAAGLISALIAAYGFYTLVKLFSLYERGKIFLEENVALYRRLGIIIITAQVAGIAVNSLTAVALTIDNPPGRRMLTVSLSSSDVMMLIIGLLVMLVARIMDAGRELHEDHELTV